MKDDSEKIGALLKDSYESGLLGIFGECSSCIILSLALIFRSWRAQMLRDADAGAVSGQMVVFDDSWSWASCL